MKPKIPPKDQLRPRKPRRKDAVAKIQAVTPKPKINRES